MDYVIVNQVTQALVVSKQYVLTTVLVMVFVETLNVYAINLITESIAVISNVLNNV